MRAASGRGFTEPQRPLRKLGRLGSSRKELTDEAIHGRISQVLAACDAKEGTQAVALRFKVSESWVRRIVQQRRETGQVAAKTTRDRTPVWQSWTEWLLNKLAARPDMYLRELKPICKRNGAKRFLCKRSAMRAALGADAKKDADRCRAGSTGRCGATYTVAGIARRHRSEQGRFHRRNLGENEHEAALRPVAAGDASEGKDAVCPLANDHVSRRAACWRLHRSVDGRRRDQRPCVSSVGRTTLGADARAGRHRRDG